MALILCIETATTVCSVAIAKEGEVISCVEQNQANIHASALTVFIHQALEESNISLKELDAIAISKGPGSYTGLRIGVSTAKGLCYALDKPLIAVNTLEAMTYGLKSFSNSQIFKFSNCRINKFILRFLQGLSPIIFELQQQIP